MRAVLLSIKPKYCELIASGKKTIEVRKTKPKIDTPFKCYIYCTIGNGVKGDYIAPSGIQCGKVIGEFVCVQIDRYYYLDLIGANSCDEGYVCGDGNMCLTYEQLWEYGKGADLFGWHITDLKLYDKPKDLSEFYVEGDCDCMNCRICVWFDRGNGYVEDDCDLAYKGLSKGKSFKPIIRPPQSWCYVEELGE